MKKEKAKYYLGLDIGIGSVGWGIIGEAGGEHWLEDFGVRLFNVPEDPQNKKSWAEKRREFRSERRLLNRWHCRREDLKQFFGKVFGDNFLQELEKFVKKTTNLLKYDETKFFNPYVIRCRALSSKIELVELLHILLHISKYRGYKSFYQDDNLDEIEQLHQEIKGLENNSQTNNNSERQKELAEKRKRLNELEKKEENKAVAETEKLFRENDYGSGSVAEMVIGNEKFRHSQNKELLSARNHNPEGIEFSKIDKKSEKFGQDSQANEIIKQIIEETDKENLKWEKGKKYYDAIVGNKGKEIDGLDDNRLSDEKKKVKLQAIVTTKFGKLNHKHLVFSRELLAEETQKILEEQSKYYPQLKDKLQYTLWKNGEPETKEFPTQEVIKTIIFRQRDFEDGPTKLEKDWKIKTKEISHLKKHNRNIASKSFADATGYCQFFSTERRGWHCSLIHCCFQFINEFSQISDLRAKELGGIEKMKQIHQQVFEWLIFPTGYQPKTLSREGKEKGKKRETLRKQLEEFLNELIGKENYSFPKGTEFKTDFLDVIKENSNFYSALWKNCSAKFYLNYEDYQKTVFYQMGKIIFEDISPWRRKKKLDELGKEHSLEPFQDCLTKLEKYDKGRTPASVSFRYMIKTVEAFLAGKKHGEFQFEFKKEPEEKPVKEPENSRNKKESTLWSPWMHPDLVRNPAVFRSFNQTRKILKNLFLSYPQGFATINIETGRDLWNSEEERKRIERKNQDKFKEKEEIVQKLKDNLNIPVNETNIKKYRLWEDQNEKLWLGRTCRKKPAIKETNSGGICLYCGQEIDIYKLENTEIDHIIPQSKWANDSFNNLTLTHYECNQVKKERLPFHFFQTKTRKEQRDFKKIVDNLYKTRNPFKHKFLTLGEEEGWEGELEDFVSRNLNDTRHIAIKLIQYIRNELNKNEKYLETRVQSIKGSLTSYFRQQLFDRSSVFHYKEQLRSLTPYHHAIDAIVLAHFKSRGYIQLLEDLAKIDRSKQKFKKQKLTSEQFTSLGQEIIKKWNKPKWELKKQELSDEYTENAIKTLEDATKQKEIIDNLVIFSVPNLKNVVEQRIPVQLKKLEKEPDWNPEEGKEIKEVIIEIKEVLPEDKYRERIENLKDKRGNLHYPYISWVADQKIKKEIIASERAGYRKKGEEILPGLCEKLRKNEKIDLPKNISLGRLVEKIGLEKLNFEYGEKYNFLIARDRKKKDNYTIWDTSKYAGFGVKNNGKAEKIKNIELFRKKRSGDRSWLTENYKWLLRPDETFTFNYSENLESELMKLVGLPLIYTGTTGDNVLSINIVGLVYDKKENLQTIYPEQGDKIIKVSNTINSLGTRKKSIKKISLSIKLLKIDILGKRRK